MKKNRLPYALVCWLEDRGHSESRWRLTEDEIFSAAVMCLDDCSDPSNANYEIYGSNEFATLKAFVKRESKTHTIAKTNWYAHDDTYWAWKNR